MLTVDDEQVALLNQSINLQYRDLFFQDSTVVVVNLVHLCSSFNDYGDQSKKIQEDGKG